MIRAALFVGLLVALVACRSEERRSAEAVLGAIERLRDADETQRKTAVAAVEATTSPAPEAEAARRACIDAYRALGETQRLVHEAKGPPIDRAKLDLAQAELAKARTGIELCSRATVALRRALGR
ncbi:MAG: hypothetical protein FJ096_14585 [Deltaproteobacteria bacterium]|nr:hypothetical protein [Deltaproteobacteria bacterium]